MIGKEKNSTIWVRSLQETLDKPTNIRVSNSLKNDTTHSNVIAIVKSTYFAEIQHAQFCPRVRKKMELCALQC